MRTFPALVAGVSLVLPVLNFLSLASLADAKVPRVAHPNSRHTAKLSSIRTVSNLLANTEGVDDEGDDVETGTGWDTVAPSVTAAKDNVWRALSNDEAAGVIQFIHDSEVMNVTSVEDAGPWDNTITVVDTLTPNKTDVLSYLNHNGSKPERWAKATIWYGAFEVPYVQDFQIGPLPISGNTTISPLNWPTTKGVGRANIPMADEDLATEFMYNVSSSVSDIVTDLLNGTATGADDDDLEIWGIDPLWHPTPNVTIQWVTFWRIPASIFDGDTLMPQGLYFELNTTGRDPSQWSVLGWLYNNNYYNSTDAFRSAWDNGELEKTNRNYDGAWVGTDYAGEEGSLMDEMSKKPPPVSVLPSDESIRYKLDVENQYVEWMDFSFYVSFSRDTGLRLFDINFRGDRIIYELGLEEAIAHYAGNDPIQSGVAYLDSYYGFGPYAFELLAGYDCPTYASYLNSTVHAGEQSKTHRNSICMFEYDQGYLMQRHSTQQYISATKNIAFVVRTVSTVGNYDYNFDYTFYLDGTIETTVRASGYIQSAHYYGNEGYGYQIHDGLSGSMHDHVLLFKADLDILGTANSFANHSIVPTTQSYPWSHGVERNTMKLEKSYLETEDEGKLNWPANGASMFVIVNKNETNDYGEERGYRIMPARGGGMHLTIQNSSTIRESANFATHGLYVTQQKDNEPHAAHANNNHDTADPIVNFNDFFNGESLDQEDLVVWFNLGMHHVPHTGDLPNTVFTTAQGSMQILPHNYLHHDPSRDNRQTVRVVYDDGEVQSVKKFGAEMAKGTVNVTNTVPDFHSYLGDVSVRKFPYDPQNPFNDTDSI